jgi:S-DNA-T family DNA segregation ATPase FtsK/SpoIIIE
VDRVEVLEPGGDGRFSGLCPDGYVYNIEVEGTHTYQIAGGVVAHNCQELFRHEKYGEQAKQLAIKVMTKARKCAITLVWVTPEPSADSLPRELAKIVSHGVCFAIGDYQGNDAILGTGAYKRGISAVDLDPQENIGTAMAFGFAGRPGLLRSFYIRKDATTDELTPIARRSLDPWKGAQPMEPREMRDLVLDVHEALGSDDTLKATRMVARLLDLAPNYRPYQSLNATQLAEWLTRDGVPVKELNGVLTVRARLVLEVLNRRQGVE